MVIDVHAHIIVPEILRESAPNESWRPAVSWVDSKQVIDFAGKQIKSALREFVHIERTIEEQSISGISHTVLAPWVSILRYNAPPELTKIVLRPPVERRMSVEREVAEPAGAFPREQG